MYTGPEYDVAVTRFQTLDVLILREEFYVWLIGADS